MKEPYRIKYDDLLKLIQLQLKEKSLSLTSPLQDLSVYYKKNEKFREELKRRLQNRTNHSTIVSAYKNELFDNLIIQTSRIDPIMGKTSEQVDEVHFGIEIYVNINKGKYQVIDDSLKDFFHRYFKPSSSKKENINNINVVLEKIAELYSKVMFILELEELEIEFNKKGAKIKNLLDRYLYISSKQSLMMEKEVGKINWAGSIAELARLFIILARTGWIPNFQKEENGPNTARAILHCFSVNEDEPNNEANYNSLHQALKSDNSTNISNETISHNFGKIKMHHKNKN